MKTLPMTKSYNGRRVLALPEIELPEGSLTVLMGANGSGKSTFAKIAAGLLRPDGNGPVFEGHPRIGYLPQKPYAFHMSTRKNLRIMAGDPAWERELAELLGLHALMDTGAAALSGGETARMALARILLKPFDLLILDEPSAALDMDYTLRSEEAVRKYMDRFGTAVLLITHSVGQARRTGEELLFFKEGGLVEKGRCAEHLENPVSRGWKEFLEFYG